MSLPVSRERGGPPSTSDMSNATSRRRQSPQRHRRNQSRTENNFDTPPSQKKPTNGLYQDGEWWCNCTPRQRAAHRETKKEGPTKGHWFHTCTMRPRCNFFMWDDEAQLRENAILNATEVVEREELPPRPTSTQKRLTSFYQVTPGSRRKTRDLGPDDSTDSGSGSGSGSENEPGVMGTPCPPSKKRKRNALQDEDEFDLDELDSDDERQVAAWVDTAPNSEPRQGAATAPLGGVAVTPEITRTVDRFGGLPTPRVARTLFPGDSASVKRQKTVSFEDPPDSASRPTATATSSDTPTKSSSSSNTVTTSPPIKSGDSPSTGPETPSAQTGDPHGTEVKAQVMNILHAQNLDSAVLSTISDILETSGRKTRGLIMSRDSTRSHAREKDLKISRLQERVTSLENKDRMNQREIADMKAKMMQIYKEH